MDEDYKQRAVQKCVDIIKDRVVGVENDLKAFLYIRKNNLQHKEDNIGGGNIVVGLTLFSAINFLGKVYYCVERPEKFNINGDAKNETETFIKFMQFLQDQGLDLGLSGDGHVLQLVWSGFRNYLAHRLTVEPGKTLLTFEFEPEHTGSISSILENAKKQTVFSHDGSDRNWIVNCDVLLSKLSDITNMATDHIKMHGKDQAEILLKVTGIEHP